MEPVTRRESECEPVPHERAAFLPLLFNGLHKVHSEKIASEPVNVKFRKAEHRGGLSPCRNGFYFLERTRSRVLANESPDHLDCLIKHLLYK